MASQSKAEIVAGPNDTFEVGHRLPGLLIAQPIGIPQIIRCPSFDLKLPWDPIIPAISHHTHTPGGGPPTPRLPFHHPTAVLAALLALLSPLFKISISSSYVPCAAGVRLSYSRVACP